MKNTCPKCGTAYAVNPSTIGRTFNCKNCGSALIVAKDGLTYKDAAAAPAPVAVPAPVAAPAEPAGGAFNFDEPAPGRRDDDEDRPAKKKKWKREDDEEPEPKRKRKREEDAEDDFAPMTAPRRRQPSGGFADYLTFQQFAMPLLAPVVFWTFTVLFFIYTVRDYVEPLISIGSAKAILYAFGILFIALPFTILMFRMFCEAALLLLRIHERLGELKESIRKQG
jgi:hypothetical protein